VTEALISFAYTMYPSSRISYNLISYVVFNLTQHYQGQKEFFQKYLQGAKSWFFQ